MTIKTLFRLLNPTLFDLIQPYAVTSDQMPEEYRTGRRPLHDDWAILSWVRRMDCAYRVPLPFRIKSGEKRREWLLFDPTYPLAPDNIPYIDPFDGLTYVLTDRGGYGLVTYEAFIGGEWRTVFRKFTRGYQLRISGKLFGWSFDKVLSKRYRLSWYFGLHQDNHVSRPDPKTGLIRSDLMTWFPEIAMSFVPEI